MFKKFVVLAVLALPLVAFANRIEGEFPAVA